MKRWKPPASVQAVCSQQNVDDLRALFAQRSGGGAMFTAIKTTLGAPCAACVFSPESAANWQPVVELVGNQFLQNNFGACLALRENESCGRAGYEIEECLKLACPAETCGPNTTTCTSKAVSGACSAISATLNSSCPKLQESVTICDDFVRTVIVACGGGVDAGVN